MQDSRKLEIERAEKEYLINLNLRKFDLSVLDIAGMGFKEGIKWADKNPKCGFHLKNEELKEIIKLKSEAFELAQEAFNDLNDEYKKQTQALEIAVEALEKVGADYEIDWADKARLRDFVRHQMNSAKEALERIRECLGSKG